ncbi:MAG: hypothetical protein ACOYYS_02500 [Chloroflexota bacterium]
MTSSAPSPLRRLATALGWTRHSFYLFSVFVLVCGLIVYVWWPLAAEVLAYIDWEGPWWLYFDWLLVGIWLAMSLLIMAGADLRVDAKIVFVGAVGGLVIEAWGTQTNLWHYYTAERPPLWIIPAWPIAALSTDRLVRVLGNRLSPLAGKLPGPIARRPFFLPFYWLIFLPFYALMLLFVAPTFDKSLTWMALLLCALLIATPTDYRMAILTFLAGAGLGYFLELWGTTRQCWTYYTLQTPPFFAVLAHGMAAVAFWRTVSILNRLLARIGVRSGAL